MYVVGITERDWSYMRHYTHDRVLVRRLEEMVRHRSEMRGLLDQKLKDHGDVITPITAVISHPHGRKKYLDVKEWKGDGGDYKDGGRQAVKYNNTTCAGSSGGAVLVIGGKERYGRYGRTHPHSGATADDMEVGISANWSLFW